MDNQNIVQQPIPSATPIPQPQQIHQPQSPLPIHPPEKKINRTIILAGILFLLLLVGTGGYYLNMQKQNSVKEELLEATSQKNILPTTSFSPTSIVTSTPIDRATNGKQRITLKEGYYFDVTIPEGYSLIEGRGDYAGYVVRTDDPQEDKLIGFAKGSSGGEMGPRYPIVIDNIPLVIGYRKDIGCPADISSEEYSPPLKMSFGIMTWCTDAEDTQLPVYKQVIESVIFGQKLRNVLSGKEPVPSEEYTP